jgi:hypothetical protein
MGLGEIAQQSALGAPLRIVVPVIAGPGEEISGECFKLVASSRGDGIPEVVNARIALERVGNGARLLITAPRSVDDPIVRVTVQAGCANPMRREYTLLLDPVGIDTPVVQDAAPRGEGSARSASAAAPATLAPAANPAAAEAASPVPPPRSAPRRAPAPVARAADAGARPAAPTPRTSPPARAARKPAPVAPATAAPQGPRLSVSAAPPTVVATPKAIPEPAKVDADPARAPVPPSQGPANPAPPPAAVPATTPADALDAETAALRKRVEELTALVDRMQQEMRATEALAAAQAQRIAAESAARAATPQATLLRWWGDAWPLLAALIGLAALIAAGLTWKRSRTTTEPPSWQAEPASTAQRGGGAEPPMPAAAAVAAGATTTGPATVSPARGPVTIAPAQISEVDVSELSHVTEEAGVYLAFNRVDRAIEVLQEHIHAKPRSIPAAWLMLLDLYRTQGREDEFRKLADEFHHHFNAETPRWETYPRQEQAERGLEAFPHLIQRLIVVWGTPESRPFLEHLLYENRDGRRNGFSLAAYEDILFLRQLADLIEPATPAAGPVREIPRAVPGAAAPATATVPRPTPSAASIVRTRRPVTLDLELALDNDMLEAARAQSSREKQKRGA